jgi:hypothetical protein
MSDIDQQTKPTSGVLGLGKIRKALIGEGLGYFGKKAIALPSQVSISLM